MGGSFGNTRKPTAQTGGGDTENASNTCNTCGTLRSHEHASQKYGWPQNDTFLPSAFGSLVLVKELRSGGSRAHQVLQCPACEAHFEYRTDYEFLVNGSEDDEFVTRLTTAQAAALLAPT